MARPEGDLRAISADDPWPLDDPVLDPVLEPTVVDDCVISALLGGPPDADDGQPFGPLSMAPVEVRALGALADGGLLPPLRMRPRSAAGPRHTPVAEAPEK
jgi:hypothetical protein